MPVRTQPIPRLCAPARRRRRRARRNTSALQNPFLGIALTKAQKHAKSAQKKTLFRTKYMRCKAKQEAKGKTVYPDPGAKKCKAAYNKWQKHRGKVGERAMKLASKLERKGKLDPQLKAALDEDLAASAAETQIDPNMSEAELMMMADEGAFDLEMGGDDVSSDNTMLYAAVGGLALVGVVGGILLLRK